MRAAARPPSRRRAEGRGRAPAGRAARRGARGFSLLEVLLALALLLVGGVSLLSVFTLAVVHRVERDVEARMNPLRAEALSLAQGAVDAAKGSEPPRPVVGQPMSEPSFYADVSFAKSPNGEPSWVADIRISFRQGGREDRAQRTWQMPPAWLSRSVLDPR